MNTVINLFDKTLDELAVEINVKNNELEAIKVQAVYTAIELGDLLAEAQDKIKSKKLSSAIKNLNFIDWLKTNTTISQPMAYKYIKLAQDVTLRNSKLVTSTAFELLGASEEVKQAVVDKVANGETLTKAQARKLVEEEKAALVAKHAKDLNFVNQANKEALEKTTRLYAEKLATAEAKPANVAKYEAELAKLRKMLDESDTAGNRAGRELLEQDARLKGQQIILTRLSNELEVAKRSVNNTTKVAEAKDEILKAIKFHKDSIVALEKLLK